MLKKEGICMRVAFASTDGVSVNEHFGHAKYWEVYDIGADAAFVESRMVHAACSCHDPRLFSEMLSALSDCEALFVAKIGEGAAAFVISQGKRVFEAAGDLTVLIETLRRQQILEG